MRPMRIVPIAFALLAAGCVQVEHTMVINRNGSGTYELRYAISEDTVNQMRAMFQLKDQIGAGTAATMALDTDDARVRAFFDPQEENLTRVVKGYAKYGVELDRVTVESRRGMRQVRLKANVARLASLASSDLFPDYGFSIVKTDAGNYRFEHKPPRIGEDDPFDMSDTETVKQLAPFLGGLRIVTKLQFPGQVIESNAGSFSRYTAVWTCDFDKDPNAMLRIQRDPMQAMFDGQGSDLPAIRQEAAPRAAPKPAPKAAPKAAPAAPAPQRPATAPKPTAAS